MDCKAHLEDNVKSILGEYGLLNNCTPQPQQKEYSKQQEEPKQKEKGGRPKGTFKDRLIDDTDGKHLEILKTVIAERKGKDVALVILCAMEFGWLLKPTFSQVEDEFGDIGSRQGYNKYFDLSCFKKEEIEGIKALLGKRF